MVHVVALLMSAAMATAVLAAPMPQAPGGGQGTVCFDDFDCLIVSRQSLLRIGHDIIGDKYRAKSLTMLSIHQAGGKCAKDETLLGGLLG